MQRSGTWGSLFFLRLLFGLVLAFVLTVFPLPLGYEAFRPPWVLLFILYSEIYLPSYFSVMAVFLLGVIMDVMLFSVLGEHAFSMLLTTWLVSLLQVRSQVRRFHRMPQTQQIMWIGCFCFINELSLYSIDTLLGFYEPFWFILVRSMLGIVCWSLVRRFYPDSIIHPLSRGISYDI